MSMDDNGTLTEVNPASAMDVRGGAPDEPGVGVETIVSVKGPLGPHPGRDHSLFPLHKSSSSLTFTED
jgi:hypothetical protein